MLKSKKIAGDESISTEDIELSLQEYEKAVRKEQQLRNIIPGLIRIVPPSAGNLAEEEASIIAKQLLGKEYDIGVEKRELTETGKLSPIAIGALAFVSILLISLLGFLSLMYLDDPSGAKSMNGVSNTIIM